MPVYIVLFFALLLQPGYAQLPAAKPVPPVQAIPLPYQQVSFESGREGEKAIFRQPARWVDYSGQVAPGVLEGLTLMDHPANPRHPAAFHVREDGWMGAVFTQKRPHVIRPAEPPRLRYGLYVHAGLPPRDALDAVWRRFAAMTRGGE